MMVKEKWVSKNISSLLFLRLNNMDLSAPLLERFQVFMALAQGRMSGEELSAWFERCCGEGRG